VTLTDLLPVCRRKLNFLQAAVYGSSEWTEQFIKEHGIEAFLIKEEKKWCCPECGGVICCHNGLRLNCDMEKLRQNRKYRWNEE
jgi:hypothetical protein